MISLDEGAATQDGSSQVLRLCLDVNVFAADFLSRRKGASLGASSRILDMVEDGACALGPVQLVVSWRMLTTLGVILERDFQVDRTWTDAVCQAIAAMAEAGPHGLSPSLVLGGTGLLPMTDREDGSVAEAAMAGNADLFLTHDIDDFEAGPKSKLSTMRIQTGRHRNAEVIMLSDPLRSDLLIATPKAAIGWLRGQTAAPVNLLSYKRSEGSVQAAGLTGRGV